MFTGEEASVNHRGGCLQVKRPVLIREKGAYRWRGQC